MVNSASTSAASKVRNVNRTYLFGFLDAFRSDAFKENFNYKRFNANNFCQWIAKTGQNDNAPESVKTLFEISDENLARLNEKVENDLKRKKEKGDETSENSDLLKSKFNSVVDVLATQQVRQILRASLAVHVYCEGDDRIYQLFTRMFKDSDTSPKYLVGTTFLPLILGKARQKNKICTFEKASRIEAIL